MKITSVDIIKTFPEAATATTAVGGVPWCPVCVRVNTDEGISGFGEIGLAYGNAQTAAFGMGIDFAKCIIGMDPMNIEAIWNKLHRLTFWGMGGGVVFAGISGIDIALWDIKGKTLGAPVYQLLGGKTNPKLRAYASQLQFDWGKESRSLVHPEEYAHATQKAMADGFSAVKVDPIGFDLQGKWMGWSSYGPLQQKQIQVAVDRVAAMREAGGPDLDIIIELHSLTDATSSVQLGRALEPLNCFYYEEPTQPLNSAMFKNISQKLSIPLATGERSYSRWGFRPFFEDRTLAIIQPDLGNTGGLTEGKKICDMAHVYDIGVQVHVCGGPIATAAALHLEAVIPNFVIHELHASALIDSNINLCTHNYTAVDGYFEVPDLPGIGQELTEDALKASEIVTIR